jgi:hypothetical protein
MAMLPACLAAAIIPAPDWLRVPLLAALVLVLPGYAIAAACFGPRDLPPAERSVYVVAFSIATAALGGLALQVVLALGRVHWVIFLAAVTAGATIVARARGTPINSTPRRTPSMNPFAVAGLIVAACLAVASIAIATDGAREQRAESHFTSLWALPEGGLDALATAPLAIGVHNHEGAATRYLLVVTRDDRTELRRRRTLESNEAWRLVLPPPPDAGGAIRVSLYRGGDLYRQVVLEGLS